MARSKAPKTPQMAVTTVKDRSQWFLSRSTFPLRDAAPIALERFWDHLGDFTHVPGVEWTEAGPRNIPGRVTSLVIDPQNPKTLYAGSATGGVWTSDDGGDTWRSCWPRLLTQNIGALAIDSRDGKSIICATGEANLSAEVYPGSGVFQSDNRGFTWTSTFTTPSGGALDEASRATMPRRIGAIAFGFPTESGGGPRIALGAVTKTETMPAALYLDSGGNGLQPVTFWGDRSYNCYSVVFHPVMKDRIYAAIEPRGTLNGIWRTDDFGKSWVRLGKGLPGGEYCGRISLAIAPTDPNVLYALISDNTNDHHVLGVYKTTDGGERWKEVGGAHFAAERQLSYNNCIAVHPKDHEFVVCGCADLHLSTDGAKSWTQITTGQRGEPGSTGGLPKNYVHNDHHAIVITPEGVIYSGNDAGVASSHDRGVTWKSSGEGMVTAMFYAVDVAQSDSRIFGGGTQDNGTLITGIPPAKSDPRAPEGHFVRVLSSDGGWLRFDPADAEHVFGSTQSFLISRHKRGEPWACGDVLANWADVTIKDELLLPNEKTQRSLIVIEIGPSARKGGLAVYVGTSRLWRTSNDGETWVAISDVFDGSSISAIACSSTDPNLVIVGTSNGGIFRTRDGGASRWSANLAGPAVPKRLITGMEFHPVHAKTVVITTGSTGMPGVSLTRSDDATATGPAVSAAGARPYGHVFRSVDEGDTWEEIDNNQLPDVVYNALAFETHSPYRIFVGGDAGVWVTTKSDYTNAVDCGWASFAGNMPNVIVSDLSFHHTHRILTAATYGRGIWRHKAHEPLSAAAPIPAGANADQGPSAVGFVLDPSTAAPELLAPVDGAVFDNFPRTTLLSWQPVTGAIGYAIDVFFGGSWLFGIGVTEPHASFDFVGAQAGSWQVWALFKDGRRSPGSVKRTFQYTR